MTTKVFEEELKAIITELRKIIEAQEKTIKERNRSIEALEKIIKIQERSICLYEDRNKDQTDGPLRIVR